MGWDVDLVLPGGSLAQVDSQSEGSIVAVGGSTDATMCVTYNYSPIYYEKLGYSVADYLKDKKASDTLDFLSRAVAKFGTITPTRNYWDATEGNAGHILVILAKWAKQHPTGIWRIQK